MALLLNNLGTYTTIEQVWADHPEGGREGDYVIIGSSTYYWDKYSRCWVQTNGTPSSGGGGSQLIDGDLTITGDLGVGGDAMINGHLYVNGQEVIPGAGGGGGGGSTGTAQMAFKSMVFRRSDGRPDAPQGGGFGSPVPSGWYDSVPQGTAPIWMSSRYFTSDNQRPAGLNDDNWNIWSTPAQMSDTEDFDVEFSPWPTTSVPVAPEPGVNTHIHSGDQLWFDPVKDPTANWYQMNWMATRSKYINSSGNEQWTQWKIILIKGEKGADGADGADGANGDGFRSVYTKTDGRTRPTITNQNYPPSGTPSSPGWKKSVSELSLSLGDVLWMAEKRCANGVWGNWGDPVRISGTDGEPGAPGNPGADGTDIEFIYKRSNSLPGASDYAPASVDEDDAYPEDEGWTDNPVGVGTVDGEFAKYEWMCQRTKPAGVNQHWGPWIGPFVWSAYGDQGMDGDGLEYIYRRIEAGQSLSSTIANPSYRYSITSQSNPNIVDTVIIDNYRYGVYLREGGNPDVSNDWRPEDWDNSKGTFLGWIGGGYNRNGEWIPQGWTDDPKGVTSQYVKEYMSIRKRKNGRWDDWCAPALWAMFSEDHILTIDEDGYWRLDGNYIYKDGQPGQPVRAEGENGTGVKIEDIVDYLTNAQKTADVENIGSGATSLEGVNVSGLTTGDCYIVEYVTYESSQWTKKGYLYAYNGGTATGVNWINNWKELGQFRGEPGQSQYMHIAWATAVDTSGSTPVLPSGASWCWRYEDRTSGLSYDWMGILVDDRSADSQTFTEYEWHYTKGVDGAFQEFVYIRTKKNSNPGTDATNPDSNGHTNSQSEFLPRANPNNVNAAQPELKTINNQYEYTDDPKSVNSEYKYCWMSKRTKDSEGQWSGWSTPALWAVYSESQTWVEVMPSEVVVDCDELGIVSTEIINLQITAQLRYGNEICQIDSQRSSAITDRGTLLSQLSGPTSLDCSLTIEDDGDPFTSGRIRITLYGTDGSGAERNASTTIPIRANWQGPQGSQGRQGTALRFRGAWSSTVSDYTYNTNFRDCVKHNGRFWLLNVTSNGTSTYAPGDIAGQWIDGGTTGGFVATELLLAENATIELLSTNKLIFLDENGHKTAGINEDGQGSYKTYYTEDPYGIRKDDNANGWTYYHNNDQDNTIAWMIGPSGVIVRNVNITMEQILLSSNTVRRLDYSLDGQDEAVSMTPRYIYYNEQSDNNGKIYKSSTLVNNEPTGEVVGNGTYAEAAQPLEDLSDPDNVEYFLPVVVIEGGRIKRRYEFRRLS